jgi:DNA mismatch repair protein MutS2
LDETNKALVISGPNAGGKTVVLKTAGLFALMAKHTIPIPARPGARVDYMQCMADIGDMQTVSGDLSTFSGHLVVCREMLSHAKNYSGNSLVLLDEIGTGTDPAQVNYSSIIYVKFVAVSSNVSRVSLSIFL